MASEAKREEGDFVDEKQNSSQRARRHWSVFAHRLRDSLRHKSTNGQSLQLILFDSSSPDGSDCTWITHKDASDLLIKCVAPSTNVSLDSLATGFDNTGNVRVWPGSEALAWALLRRQDRIANGRLLELGAGFLGLAGFLMAKTNPNIDVWITDGNSESVKSLERIQTENSDFSSRVNICQLIWGKKSLGVQFDTILAADCVFFDRFHECLMECITGHLKPTGTCFISSPRRKGSLQKFVDYVEKCWTDYELKFEQEMNELIEDKIGDIWKSDEEKDEKLPVIATIKLRSV